MRSALLVSCLVLATWARPALADVTVDALSGALGPLGPRSSGTFGLLGNRPLSGIVRMPAGAGSTDPRVSRIGERLGVVRGSLADLSLLAAEHPEWRIEWTPQRRLLMDRAVVSTGALPFRERTQATGRGVAVGVVDSGVDLLHPDLRREDGTSRVAWMLDFSLGPIGLHPEVEGRCASMGIECAALSGVDIDAYIEAGRSAELPQDSIGHGTHVASLAAGRDVSHPQRYSGMAPEADLLIARVTDALGGIDDATVLKAVETIFYLTGEYRQGQGAEPQPTVINLSLGSDFGPHDGASALGDGLSSMVGEDHPGRAIVVASGNSAGVFVGYKEYPEPLGIHTEVDVPPGTSVRVPVLVLAGRGRRITDGALFIWIDFRARDRLSVGFDRPSGRRTGPVRPGGFGSFAEGDTVVTIVNGLQGDPRLVGEGRAAAVVIFEGAWDADDTHAVRLEGEGTASLWVQSAGDIGAEHGSLGALFPAALKEGTVNVPAAHPALIAVGATYNRESWPARDGTESTVLVPGQVPYFSSAGPNFLGSIKPDLLAPGGFVVGAMSAASEPRGNPRSIFKELSCDNPDDCLVVDDLHAVSTGTSMASPVVAGAVALMLEKEPSLTQPEVRALLQTSARAVHGATSQQAGAGHLDLERTLDALDVRAGGVIRSPSASHTRMVLGSSFARPDGEWPVRGLVQVRDHDDNVAEGFDAQKLRLDASPGIVQQGLTRVGPGLFEFAIAAPKGTGGRSLYVEVHHGGTLLTRSRLAIAADANVARYGARAQGGCAVLQPSIPRTGFGKGAALCVGLIVVCARKRRAFSARRGLSLRRWRIPSASPRTHRCPTGGRKPLGGGCSRAVATPERS